MAQSNLSRENQDSKGDQRIQEILDAAIMTLVEAGYHNFSLRKVALRAGISVGNLQYYFHTKEGLVSAMLDATIDVYLRKFDVIRREGTPREQLTSIIALVVNDLKKKHTTFFFPELWSLVNHEKGIVSHMDAMYGKYREVLEGIISDINPLLSKKQIHRLSLFICASLEGHTLFVGYRKPWTREAPHVISMATESFLWMIENEKIPD